MPAADLAAGRGRSVARRTRECCTARRAFAGHSGAAHGQCPSRYPATSLRRLCGWRSYVEEMRNGGDKLRWRERLRQHDAVRDALRRPIVNIFSAHINDGKVWIDFSGMSSDSPAVNLISSKVDVGNKGSVFPLGRVKQFHRVVAGRSYDGLESPISKALFDDALDKMVVLDDQDHQWIFQLSAPHCKKSSNNKITRERGFRSNRNVQK
jgi:hypothetical protein